MKEEGNGYGARSDEAVLMTGTEVIAIILSVAGCEATGRRPFFTGSFPTQ